MRRATTNPGTHCVYLNTTTDRQDTGRKGVVGSRVVRVVREGRVGQEDGKNPGTHGEYLNTTTYKQDTGGQEPIPAPIGHASILLLTARIQAKKGMAGSRVG